MNGTVYAVVSTNGTAVSDQTILGWAGHFGIPGQLSRIANLKPRVGSGVSLASGLSETPHGCCVLKLLGLLFDDQLI
jgi:hypothetical protein